MRAFGVVLSVCGILVAVGLVWLVGPSNVRADWPPAPRIVVEDEDDVGLLPPSVRAERDENSIWKVTFTYKPAEPITSVSLAGSFNGWNMGSLPMKGPDESGTYSTQVTLGPGEHRYKFVVNHTEWIPDPANPDADEADYGNSILRLGRVATLVESNGAVGDGKIEAAGLLHDPKRLAYLQPLGANQALFRYRTLAHDVSGVSLAFKGGKTEPMHAELTGPLFTYWEATVTLKAYSEPLHYTFVITDDGTKVSHPSDFETMITPDQFFDTPDWARDAVWYQIMLGRFRNGNTSNDPDVTHPWTSDWFRPDGDEGKDGRTFYNWYVFDRLYGGDFDGLEQKLGYLKHLGVNSIYLNPIFQSHTHHKYDAQSYIHVDETFGTRGDFAEAVAKEDLNDPSTWVWTDSDKRFLAFLKTAHEQGFRVIIDGVFNHVGDRHTAFLDVKKNGKDSPYADWFDVTSWEPFKYNGWAGFGGLPVFRKDAEHGLASEQVRNHIDNITKRWMDPDGDGDPSDGIDGWRLDVPEEIPAVFWQHWREHVRSINPQAYITGEIWTRADEWLDGKHFDAVMNYEFARAAVRWIANKQKKIEASNIDHMLAEQRMAYPAPATFVLQNLLDSHDTDRFVSMCLNPDRGYDQENRVQDSNPNYNNDKPGPEQYARLKLAALLQMTYLGAPMVYYGDEAGMWGADDPTNRKPMLWKDLEPYEKPEENFVMADVLDWYTQVIHLRDSQIALRRGAFHTLLTDDAKDVWVFIRTDEKERVVVALNASGQDQTVSVELPAGSPKEWTTLFAGAGMTGTDADRVGKKLSATGGKLEIKVPAIGGVVLSGSQ